ncbi:MAG TPA: cytochrome b/b6 domain-containing protein [Steroidobacteraceae bacterium]
MPPRARAHRALALPHTRTGSRPAARRVMLAVAAAGAVVRPLIGWAMLSAGGYPVMLGSALHLPPISPANPLAFAILRHLHAWLAMLLFVTFLAHLAAALYHGLIRRAGVLASMLGRPL